MPDRKVSAKSAANKSRSGQWQVPQKQHAIQMMTSGAKVELQKHSGTTSGDLKGINSDLNDRNQKAERVDQETETAGHNLAIETQIGSEEKPEVKTTVYKKNKNDIEQPDHTVSRQIEDDGLGGESDRGHLIHISKINQQEESDQAATPFNFSARPDGMKNTKDDNQNSSV